MFFLFRSQKVAAGFDPAKLVRRMKSPATVAANFRKRLTIFFLIVLFQAALSLPLFSQTPSSPPSPSSVGAMRDELVVPATIHGAIRITSSWRFRVGDDPAWA